MEEKIMEKQMRKRKKFDDLTIADDFMFCKVMQDEEICKTFLELILTEEIGKIKELSSQKAVINNSESKSVRLDILVTDETGKLFNVEMQVINQHNLSKRMRYYQSAIDVASLDKGAYYDDLNDTYIIFICMFDYFKKGLPVYQFENICTKDSELYLQDGVKKIIINVDAVENTKDEDLKAFLKYMKTGVSNNEFTRRLNSMVETIKDKVTARTEYNFVPGYIMDAKYEAHEEGYKQGSHQQAIETAKILKSLGDPLDKIAKATKLGIEEIQNL